ncbi:MAG: TolC family protein [Bacteroidota bacterium]
MKKIFLILMGILIINGCLFAQEEMLSLKKALEIGVKNNFSIQILETSAEIAKNTNTLGNAGFLPNVSAVAAYNSSNSNIDIQYSSSTEEMKKNNAISTIENVGLTLNWTLFDGMKMFATRQKLQELEDVGDLSVKIQLENTISKIILAYENIVYQKRLYDAIQEMIDLSVERMKIAEKKFNVGSSSKQDYLQAKVDLNAQQSGLIRQKTMLRQSMINLNELLAMDVEKTWKTEDTILITYKPSYNDLKKTILSQNTSLMMSQKNMRVSDLSVKEVNSLRFPRLGFNSGYNYTRTENQVGQVLLNKNLGLSYGFTLSFPIYEGHTLTTQLENAKLNSLGSRLENSDITLQVQSDLLFAYETFQDAQELFTLEKLNLGNARENLDVAMKSYKLGSTSSLDLITAQKSYFDAVSRLLTSLYTTKAAEVGLMKLNGDLIK